MLQKKKLIKSCGTVVEVNLLWIIFTWKGLQLVLALFISILYLKQGIEVRETESGEYSGWVNVH